MKFKENEIVKVKSNFAEFKDNNIDIMDGMYNFANEIIVIAARDVCDNTYYAEGYWWTEDMLESLDKSEQRKDLKEIGKLAIEYLYKYGTPHTTLIITQNGIEHVDGTMSEPFELRD